MDSNKHLWSWSWSLNTLPIHPKESSHTVDQEWIELLPKQSKHLVDLEWINRNSKQSTHMIDHELDRPVL